MANALGQPNIDMTSPTSSKWPMQPHHAHRRTLCRVPGCPHRRAIIGRDRAEAGDMLNLHSNLKHFCGPQSVASQGTAPEENLMCGPRSTTTPSPSRSSALLVCNLADGVVQVDRCGLECHIQHQPSWSPLKHYFFLCCQQRQSI